MPVSIRPSAPRRIAKRVAVAVDQVSPRVDGVVVLAYHRVGGRTDSPVDIPTSVFRRQLEHLAAGADVLTLDSALRVLLGGHDAAGRRVLTFDDGTSDFVDVVLPLLVELHVPATLYLATGPVDSGAPYPGGARPLTWNAVRECVSTGLVDIGSHTHTHALLDRRDPLEVELELDVCDERIATEVGTAPTHFAYPKAVVGTDHAVAAVRRRYRTAAVAGTRPNVPGSTDPWRLHRSPIQASDDWAAFVRKAAGGMRAEDDVRRMLNAVRYRGRWS